MSEGEDAYLKENEKFMFALRAAAQRKLPPPYYLLSCVCVPLDFSMPMRSLIIMISSHRCDDDRCRACHLDG